MLTDTDDHGSVVRVFWRPPAHLQSRGAGQGGSKIGQKAKVLVQIACRKLRLLMAVRVSP